MSLNLNAISNSDRWYLAATIICLIGCLIAAMNFIPLLAGPVTYNFALKFILLAMPLGALYVSINLWRIHNQN